MDEIHMIDDSLMNMICPIMYPYPTERINDRCCIGPRCIFFFSQKDESWAYNGKVWSKPPDLGFGFTGTPMERKEKMEELNASVTHHVTYERYYCGFHGAQHCPQIDYEEIRKRCLK